MLKFRPHATTTTSLPLIVGTCKQGGAGICGAAASVAKISGQHPNTNMTFLSKHKAHQYVFNSIPAAVTAAKAAQREQKNACGSARVSVLAYR